MPSFLEITPEKLNRIVGSPNAPVIVNVRNDEDFAADPRLPPGSIPHDYRAVADWAEDLKAADEIQTPHAPQIIKLCASITVATNGLLPWLAALRDQEEHMETYLICSPAYLAAHGPKTDIASMAGHRLLHLDDTYHEGVKWLDYLAVALDQKTTRLVYNDYILVLHAAIAAKE